MCKGPEVRRNVVFGGELKVLAIEYGYIPYRYSYSNIVKYITS